MPTLNPTEDEVYDAALDMIVAIDRHPFTGSQVSRRVTKEFYEHISSALVEKCNAMAEDDEAGL